GDVEFLPLHRPVRHTLESYGYACKTGLYVPHRDTRQVTTKKGNRRSYPLIWSTDIGQNGRFNFEHGNQKKRFVSIAKSDAKLVHRSLGVALQRTSAKDDARRLVSAPIGKSFLKRYGGYVGENHVLFLLKTEDAVC